MPKIYTPSSLKIYQNWKFCVC